MDGTICNKGGLNFSRVGFPWRGEITDIYIHGELCLTFCITFNFLFVF